ncbi:MAG: hypothetical protein Tsb009_27490 [Planctomycetaceae bacterium]
MFNTQCSLEWDSAVDEISGELLRNAGVTSPPVNALDIAHSAKISVVVDRSLRVRGRHKRIGGRSTIFIRPELRTERLQWTIAHELGEAVAWRVAERVYAFDEVSPRDREAIANRFASRLLLPTNWFLADVERMDCDLIGLKRRYQTASHELIAYRLLDLPIPTTITIFDQGKLSRRKCNAHSSVPRIQRIERICALETHERNQACVIQEDGISVQCWPIHESDWKREIMRTVYHADFTSSHQKS